MQARSPQARTAPATDDRAWPQGEGGDRCPVEFLDAPGSSPCALGAAGVAGCTRCLDVCEAGAIRCAGGAIEIDASACRGCAACAMACPTGAVSVASPARSDWLARLKQLLAKSASQGVRHPILLVHTPAAVAFTRALPLQVKPLQVPALPAFGDELWLAALAAGCRGVVLLDDESLTPTARSALQERVAEIRLVAAAGPHADMLIAMVATDRLGATLARAAASRIVATAPGAQLFADKGKRGTALAALAILARDTLPVPVPLPSGASYGAVRADRQACTLCMACTRICPTGALASEVGRRQRLSFTESACVQCGLCVSGCPEQALALVPRISVSRRTLEPPRLLAEDEMAACVQCRTPFTGRRLLARSLAQARAQPGSQPSERVLHLCPGCRARSGFPGALSGAG